MKLIDYMRSQKIDDAEMASRVGGITAHGIRKLKYGERKPSLVVAARIEEVTSGAVLAVEWVRSDEEALASEDSSPSPRPSPQAGGIEAEAVSS